MRSTNTNRLVSMHRDSIQRSKRTTRPNTELAMKSICRYLVLTSLVATNVLAQPVAPTVKIICTVNYDFVQSHARDSKNSPKLWQQGDQFSGRDFFVTRQSIDLHPDEKVRSATYKVTLDAATRAFLSKACTEDIVHVLSFIDGHKFDAAQSVFYLGERSPPLPADATKRKVGDWNLASWNNPINPRVD